MIKHGTKCCTSGALTFRLHQITGGKNKVLCSSKPCVIQGPSGIAIDMPILTLHWEVALARSHGISQFRIKGQVTCPTLKSLHLTLQIHDGSSACVILLGSTRRWLARERVGVYRYSDVLCIWSMVVWFADAKDLHEDVHENVTWDHVNMFIMCRCQDKKMWRGQGFSCKRQARYAV